MQKTSYAYYPESSKVLASPCFVSLRVIERWQVVSPECLTEKLSGYENGKSLGSALWVSGAECPEHHCSTAGEVLTMFACVKHVFQASKSRGHESRCNCWMCQCGRPAACSRSPQTTQGSTTMPDNREQQKCSQSRDNSSPHEGVKQPLLEAPVGML